MKKFDFDLLIIGAGSAGVRAARVAAGLGARVCIAEERYLGGTCVNVGCIPKKLLVYASHYSEDFRGSNGYGWRPGNPDFNWRELIARKNKEIERLNTIYQKVLDESGVKIINGRATVIDPHTVSISQQTYCTENILIATGGWPTLPDIPGKEHVITSNEAFFLEALPERIVIEGGGYTGVEFAGIFNGLGVDTTLVYRGPLILRGFDSETREFLSQEIQKKGIKLILNTLVTSITEKKDTSFKLHLSNDTTLVTDKVMFATGRHPNTAGFGLEQSGVKLDDYGAVIIDDAFCSSVPSIYAIGDVTNRYNLTPVAIAGGISLAQSLYGKAPTGLDYHDIPTCIFGQPNLATIGLTEEDAKIHFSDISIYISEFTHLKHSLSGIPERTFMKLVVDKESDKVVGAHMVGPDAGEIIQGIAIAIKAGASKTDFDSTMGIHPTAAEEFVTMRQATQ